MLGGDEDIEGFLMGANKMRDSEEQFDDNQSDIRSACNLDPFKKDLGNRFSTVEMDTRESFLSINPLARSAASTVKVTNIISEDMDESRDSQKMSGRMSMDMMNQMNQFER